MSPTVAYHIGNLMLALELLDRLANPVVQMLRVQNAEEMGRLVREQALREELNG